MGTFKEQLQSGTHHTRESKIHDILEMMLFLPGVKSYFESSGFNINEFTELPNGGFKFNKDDDGIWKWTEYSFTILKTQTGYVTKLLRWGRLSEQTYDKDGIEIKRISKETCRTYTFERDNEYLEKVHLSVKRASFTLL